MSQFRVDVVPVILEPHPNAETLSIIKVFGWQVVGKTADWQGYDKAAYIPPDSMVPVVGPLSEPFAWLKNPDKERDFERVTVVRLRGVYSQGLLVPAPEGSKIGDDVAAIMGVTHYDPPMDTRGGECEKPPKGIRPVYSVESFNRFNNLLIEGEEVIITEKIHGASGRWCFYDGKFHCGSRTEWKREDPNNLWWKALENTPAIKEFLMKSCVAGMDYTIYGEVYGQVNSIDLKYDSTAVCIAAFDLWDGAEWEDSDAATKLLNIHGVHTVPVLHRGPFNEKTLRELAEGTSLIAKHVREGCVVKPVIERNCIEIGRVQLKVVGNSYLSRKTKYSADTDA